MGMTVEAQCGNEGYFYVKRHKVGMTVEAQCGNNEGYFYVKTCLLQSWVFASLPLS